MIFLHAQQFATLLGLLTIVPTGHGAVYFNINNLVIYVDPYSVSTDYSGYPKADIIFFTHDHYDHYDQKALKHIIKDSTVFAGPQCMEKHLKLIHTFGQTDSFEWQGISVQTVPSYNIINKRPDGTHFHPRGFGVGYIFTFGDKRVYISGDTELIPEMKELGPIDVAMLAKNIPYTMTDEQFIQAVKIIGAPIVYPVHYSELDRKALEKAVGPGVKLIYE